MNSRLGVEARFRVVVLGETKQSIGGYPLRFSEVSCCGEVEGKTVLI